MDSNKGSGSCYIYIRRWVVPWTKHLLFVHRLQNVISKDTIAVVYPIIERNYNLLRGKGMEWVGWSKMKENDINKEKSLINLPHHHSLSVSGISSSHLSISSFPNTFLSVSNTL